MQLSVTGKARLWALLASGLLHALVLGAMAHNHPKIGLAAPGVRAADFTFTLLSAPARHAAALATQAPNVNAAPPPPAPASKPVPLIRNGPPGVRAAAHFYSSEVLTTKPTPLTDIDLDALVVSDNESKGELVLRLYIDEQGQVLGVEVESSALGTPLTEATAKTFAAARFKPGAMNGRPVPSLMRIQVTYE